jgi:hypothetical protein
MLSVAVLDRACTGGLADLTIESVRAGGIAEIRCGAAIRSAPEHGDHAA